MQTTDDDAPVRKNNSPNQTDRKGGRPLGAMSKLAKDAREQAQQTGKLPHEILLEMARGPFEHYVHATDADGNKVIDAETGDWVYVKQLVVMDFEGRRDAAKAAAPYFAPKISTVEVIHGVGDAELDAIIAGAAAEAGVGIGPPGEGEASEGPSDGRAGSHSAGVGRERRRAT